MDYRQRRLAHRVLSSPCVDRRGASTPAAGSSVTAPTRGVRRGASSRPRCWKRSRSRYFIRHDFVSTPGNDIPFSCHTSRRPHADRPSVAPSRLGSLIFNIRRRICQAPEPCWSVGHRKADHRAPTRFTTRTDPYCCPSARSSEYRTSTPEACAACTMSASQNEIW